MSTATPRGIVEPTVGRAEQAYWELEERIVTLRLPPGALFSEQMLSAELGIGRTPVREALQRLHYEGLVVVLPRRGVLISEVEITRQVRMVELRREVERFVCRAASRRGTNAQLAQLEEIACELEQAAELDDPLWFIRLDRDMDMSIYTMAQNELAARTLQLMSGLTRRFWYIQHTQNGGVAKCARLHADIARAVTKRDGDLAAENLDRLLDYIEELAYASWDFMPRKR